MDTLQAFAFSAQKYINEGEEKKQDKNGKNERERER
jgi:hypothetical protein